MMIEDNKIIACCFGHYKSWYNGKEYFIDEMFVKNDRQKNGLGSMFIKYIEDDMLKNDIKRFTLLTKRGSSSELFYKKNGFSNIENLCFMYKNI